MIKKTAGWNNILNDKLSNNFLSDVNVVNEFSDLENAAPTNPSFIYAAYLKPGHHKFLIYCPVTQRAFYKKIIVQMNTCENYPEFPLTLDALKIKKPHQNVWKNWIEDNAESLNIACNNDISNKNFDIDAMIKDAD